MNGGRGHAPEQREKAARDGCRLKTFQVIGASGDEFFAKSGLFKHSLESSSESGGIAVGKKEAARANGILESAVA